MEKRKPHYDLAYIRTLIAQGRFACSQAALAGASAISMDESAIFEIISHLVPTDFHLSKMANAQSKVWLDLYRPMTCRGQVYLKLKATDDVFVVSFIPKSAVGSAGA